MKLLTEGNRESEETKLCPRCEECDIPITASICEGCEDDIRENAPPDGAWVNTPQGIIYE